MGLAIETLRFSSCHKLLCSKLQTFVVGDLFQGFGYIIFGIVFAELFDFSIMPVDIK